MFKPLLVATRSLPVEVISNPIHQQSLKGSTNNRAQGTTTSQRQFCYLKHQRNINTKTNPLDIANQKVLTSCCRLSLFPTSSQSFSKSCMVVTGKNEKSSCTHWLDGPGAQLLSRTSKSKLSWSCFSCSLISSMFRIVHVSKP